MSSGSQQIFSDLFYDAKNFMATTPIRSSEAEAMREGRLNSCRCQGLTRAREGIYIVLRDMAETFVTRCVVMTFWYLTDYLTGAAIQGLNSGDVRT